jgi:hypothetical protein
VPHVFFTASRQTSGLGPAGGRGGTRRADLRFLGRGPEPDRPVIHGLREEELLPPHPLAVFGGVIHEVMHVVRSMLPGSRDETEYTVAEVPERPAHRFCARGVQAVGPDPQAPDAAERPTMSSASQEIYDPTRYR